MRCARSFSCGFGAGPGGAGLGGGASGYGRGCGADGASGAGCCAPGTAPCSAGAPGAPPPFGGRQRRLRWRRGLARRSRLACGRPALCWACLFAWLTALLGGDRVDHRADVQPRGLAEVAGLVAVVARHGDHQVVAVDHHLGPRNAEAVDARGDDLLRLVQRVLGGPRPVGRAGRQCDPGAALQVDAELGLGLLVAGQKDQEVHADQQREEECQVAGRVHRRRRRCHVSLVSSRSGRQHRKGYVVLLSPRLSAVRSVGSGRCCP